MQPARWSREAFWFRATDGALLDGAVLGHGRTGVALAPELGGDVCNWLPYALFLSQHGYQVLLFDPRGQGLSPFPTSQSAGQVNADVEAGVQQLRRRGATRIVLGGASLGGSAVLSAAASIKPAVAAVVSLSGADTTTLRNNATVYAQPLNPDAAVTHLKMPVLYIADRHDGQGPFATGARKLYSHTPSTNKRLVVLPGFGHGTAMLATEKTQLLNLILTFIQTSTHR